MAGFVSVTAVVPNAGLLLISSTSTDGRGKVDGSGSGMRRSPHAGLRRQCDLLSDRRKLPPGWRNASGVRNTCKRGRLWTIVGGEAAWRGGGKDRGSQAGRMVENARRKASEAAQALSNKAGELLSNAKRSAEEFKHKSDIQGRMDRAAQAANRKFDELRYDATRNAAKWDREYGISDKLQGVKDFTAEQIGNADRQLGFRQKARNFGSDLKLKMPMYQRQFSNFLETPIGRSFVTLFMVWLIFSGWFFRILLLSMWVLPLAAPLLLTSLTKAAVVQGVCPNCGQRYIGKRNQAVSCSRCRGMVWQPRQDFSKDDSDPRIIDIEIDPQ